MKDDDAMTIRQMCDMFNVTARTLRFYESKELLSPARDGQRRLYSKRDRARLKLILRGKRFGFSLEEARQLLELYERGDNGKTQLARTYEQACERLKVMESQYQELGEAIIDLKKHLEWGAQQLAAADLKAAE
ncbi:MerR family transcriptional regulator [Profundibacter sp.]|uniref:MerR family transcriptional regulator n=1 Tax=Profundibacter sp. TaxID=3101071 RepID=UPI003D1335A9